MAIWRIALTLNADSIDDPDQMKAAILDGTFDLNQAVNDQQSDPTFALNLGMQIAPLV